MAQGSTPAMSQEASSDEDHQSESSAVAADRAAAPAPTAVRVTVNLSARSQEALERTSRLTQDTKTEVINKAVQLFDMVQAAQAEGGGVWIKEDKNSELTRTQF